MNAVCSGEKERIEKGGKCGLRSGCVMHVKFTLEFVFGKRLENSHEKDQ